MANNFFGINWPDLREDIEDFLGLNQDAPAVQAQGNSDRVRAEQARQQQIAADLARQVVRSGVVGGAAGSAPPAIVQSWPVAPVWTPPEAPPPLDDDNRPATTPPTAAITPPSFQGARNYGPASAYEAPPPVERAAPYSQFLPTMVENAPPSTRYAAPPPVPTPAIAVPETNAPLGLIPSVGATLANVGGLAMNTLRQAPLTGFEQQLTWPNIRERLPWWTPGVGLPLAAYRAGRDALGNLTAAPPSPAMVTAAENIYNAPTFGGKLAGTADLLANATPWVVGSTVPPVAQQIAQGVNWYTPPAWLTQTKTKFIDKPIQWALEVVSKPFREGTLPWVAGYWTALTPESRALIQKINDTTWSNGRLELIGEFLNQPAEGPGSWLDRHRMLTEGVLAQPGVHSVWDWVAYRATPAEIEQYEREAPWLVQLGVGVVADPLTYADVPLSAAGKLMRVGEGYKYVREAEYTINGVRRAASTLDSPTVKAAEAAHLGFSNNPVWRFAEKVVPGFRPTLNMMVESLTGETTDIMTRLREAAGIEAKRLGVDAKEYTKTFFQMYAQNPLDPEVVRITGGLSKSHPGVRASLMLERTFGEVEEKVLTASTRRLAEQEAKVKAALQAAEQQTKYADTLAGPATRKTAEDIRKAELAAKQAAERAAIQERKVAQATQSAAKAKDAEAAALKVKDAQNKLDNLREAAAIATERVARIRATGSSKAATAHQRAETMATVAKQLGDELAQARTAAPKAGDVGIKKLAALLDKYPNDDFAVLAELAQQYEDSAVSFFVKPIKKLVNGKEVLVYELPKANALQKARGAVNSLLSYGFMGYSPGYAIRNGANNLFTAMIDGVSFYEPLSARKIFWQRWGIMPSATAKGLGAAGEAWQSMAGTSTWLSRQPIGFWDTFRGVGIKGPTLTWAQGLERFASERVMEHHLKNFWAEVWPRTVRQYSEQLLKAGVRPEIVNYVRRRAVDTMNPQELRAILDDLARGAADEAHVLDDAERVTLLQAGGPDAVDAVQEITNNPALDAATKDVLLGQLDNVNQEVVATTQDINRVQELAQIAPDASEDEFLTWFNTRNDMYKQAVKRRDAKLNELQAATRKLPVDVRRATWRRWDSIFEQQMTRLHAALDTLDQETMPRLGFTDEAIARAVNWRKRIDVEWRQHHLERQAIWDKNDALKAAGKYEEADLMWREYKAEHGIPWDKFEANQQIVKQQFDNDLKQAQEARLRRGPAAGAPSAAPPSGPTPPPEAPPAAAVPVEPQPKPSAPSSAATWEYNYHTDPAAIRAGLATPEKFRLWGTVIEATPYEGFDDFATAAERAAGINKRKSTILKLQTPNGKIETIIAKPDLGQEIVGQEVEIGTNFDFGRRLNAVSIQAKRVVSAAPTTVTYGNITATLQDGKWRYANGQRIGQEIDNPNLIAELEGELARGGTRVTEVVTASPSITNTELDALFKQAGIESPSHRANFINAHMQSAEGQPYKGTPQAMASYTPETLTDPERVKLADLLRKRIAGELPTSAETQAIADAQRLAQDVGAAKVTSADDIAKAVQEAKDYGKAAEAIEAERGRYSSAVYEKATQRGGQVGVIFDDKIHEPEYWLLTRDEYVKSSVHPQTTYSMGYDNQTALWDHEAFVEDALKAGKPVPAEVLADYPDLAAKFGKGSGISNLIGDERGSAPVELAGALPLAVHDAAATTAQAVSKALPGIRARLAGGAKVLPELTEAERAALTAFFDTLGPAMVKDKAIVAKIATTMRNFALGDYSAKRTFHEALAWMMPYSYWYSFTYKNWAIRLMQNPSILSNYARYRKVLADATLEWYQAHVDPDAKALPPRLEGVTMIQPPWGGAPIQANLERFLWPLNNLMTEFKVKARSEAPGGQLMETLSDIGPTLWTPLMMLYQAALWKGGYQDAASAWGGYYTSGSRALKALTAGAREVIPGLKTIIPPGGWTPEMSIFPWSAGGDYWDKRRVPVMLAKLLQDGTIDQTTFENAGYKQKGDDWDQAQQDAAVKRILPSLASLVGGQTLNQYAVEDMQVDKMWTDLFDLKARTKTMTSKDEVNDAWAAFKQEYPWYEVFAMARATDERDRLYSYTRLVFDRLPPGKAFSQLLDEVGLDEKLKDKFFDNPTDYTFANWTEAEYTAFKAGIEKLGATVLAPTPEQEAEQDAASAEYKRIKETVAKAVGITVAAMDALSNAYWDYRNKGDDAGAKLLLARNPIVKTIWDKLDSLRANNALYQKYYEQAAPVARVAGSSTGGVTPTATGSKATGPTPATGIASNLLGTLTPEQQAGYAAYNDLQAQLKAQFGADIMTLRSQYADSGPSGSAERKAWRTANAAAYDRISKSYDFQEAYEASHPALLAFYPLIGYKPLSGSSTSISSYTSTYTPRSYGGSSGGSGGGGGSVMVTPPSQASASPTVAQQQAAAAMTAAQYQALTDEFRNSNNAEAMPLMAQALFGADIFDTATRYFAMTADQQAAWKTANPAAWAKLLRYLVWLMGQRKAAASTPLAGLLPPSIPTPPPASIPINAPRRPPVSG